MAQSKVHKLWKKGFRSQEAAVAWLASKLKVLPCTLRKSGQRVRRSMPRKSGSQGVSSSKGSSTASTFRGVIGRCRSGRELWEARAHGKVLGYYSTEDAAAAQVARSLGVKKKEILKEVNSRKRMRDLFIATHQVFGKYLPGDYEYTLKQESTDHKASKQDRG